MIIPGKESTFIGDVAKLQIATRTLTLFMQIARILDVYSFSHNSWRSKYANANQTVQM